MRGQQPRKAHELPAIQQKSVSLHSVFDLIRKKKHELSKKIIAHDDVHINLPRLHAMKEEALQESVSGQEKESAPQMETIERTTEEAAHTPARRYRTILELESLTQEKNAASREPSYLQLQSKEKDPNVRIRPRRDNFSHDKRIKTEAADLSRKATNTTQIESHRHRDNSEMEAGRIEQAKERFLGAILAIPKAMKQRTEESLLGAVEALEVFNPFANRNHRIVNICLLKMGRPLLATSSLLYKIGEELHCFYIILLGKVKLTNGALRKVCQAGETVLEEAIFSDKERRIALERAKTVGKTVLLEITAEGLRKLKEELTKFGYKLGYQEMEAIIKRNYIVKNWLRNKIRLEANR